MQGAAAPVADMQCSRARRLQETGLQGVRGVEGEVQFYAPGPSGAHRSSEVQDRRASAARLSRA